MAQTSLPINIKQLEKFLCLVLESNTLVPMIHGSPGLGKSALMAKIAEMYNLCPIDIRLGQIDPVDLNGFGVPDFAAGKSRYLPFDTFPLEGDPLPINPKTGKAYAGWLITFDEITSAGPETQAAAYKVLLDKKIGQDPIHSKVKMIAAGNLITDGAVVEEMSTALQSRMTHFHLVSDLNCWLEWAYQNSMPATLTSFVQHKPEILNNFTSDHNEFTFGCERTWASLGEVVNEHGFNAEHLPIYAGTVGLGVAHEYVAFAELESMLPKLTDMVSNPDHCIIPQRQDIQFMLTGYVCSALKDPTILQPLVTYISRLRMEMQVVFFQELLVRYPQYKTNSAIIQWILANSTELNF